MNSDPKPEPNPSLFAGMKILSITILGRKPVSLVAPKEGATKPCFGVRSMSQDKPDNCPFCDGVGRLSPWRDRKADYMAEVEHGAYVYCEECEAQTTRFAIDDGADDARALAAWNRRLI